MKKDNRKTIAIDVDDVVIELAKRWLEIYNRQWDDNLGCENITSWNIVKYVKPECGNKIYDILKHKNLYDGIEFVDGAYEGVLRIKEYGHRVVYATAGNNPMKEQLLVDNGFMEDRHDYIYAPDKSLVNADVLFDDGYHNVKVFGGIGYLFSRPWNKEFLSWTPRVGGWDEFIRSLK